ncbi:hypothetical protein GCM10008015_10990 [Flavobacterium palustre]|uniref:Uncharacterized protein n=1 Tax=Flavobacterium palustre TaxID=1476463 RepID=A0ABQ1HEG9_9FLAO|nr:hypothetical protein GCM10008015_10990 [Flavobacterium palustre]
MVFVFYKNLDKMAKVYLDALLPREDFDIDESQNSAKKKESFSISDLREDDFFLFNIT